MLGAGNYSNGLGKGHGSRENVAAREAVPNIWKLAKTNRNNDNLLLDPC